MTPTEQTQSAIKEKIKAESYLKGNYSQYDKDGAYDDLQEINAKLQTMKECFENELEFLVKKMAESSFNRGYFSFTRDKHQTQLDIIKEQTEDFINRISELQNNIKLIGDVL